VKKLISSGIQYYAVWRRSGRPNVSRSITILAFAVAGWLASLEAFFGFNRMVQWTDWYVVTSAKFAVVPAIAILAPLLLASGALFALTAAPERELGRTLRNAFLFLNACALTGWLWFFHGWRVYADVGPDYAALHWPQSPQLPLHVRFLWSS